MNNEFKVYKESGSENNKTEETEREKNLKKMEQIIQIKIDSDNDERHEEESIKNTTEGNSIEAEGKISTMRKRSI